MAAPVIDGIDAPPTFTPGVPFTVKIRAHDPDAVPVTYTGTVTDQAGNPSQATITLLGQDPLTYKLAGPGTIVQSAADPSMFTVTN